MKVFLVILDEGPYTDDTWEVSAICSSLDKARETASDLIAADYCSRNTLPKHYYPPYGIHVWTVDGGHEEAADPPMIEQIAKSNAKVRQHIEEQHKRAELRAQIKAEADAANEKQRRRSQLDRDVLANKLTHQQYAQAVLDLI